MVALALIGGSGLTTLTGLHITKRVFVPTPYGEPSGPVTYGEFANKEIVFLPRHGYGHTIPPHKINYRANIWALKEVEVEKVISVAAVGGIRKDLVPNRLVIPDQIVDYTTSRISTFFEDGQTPVTHIDFTEPYCKQLIDLVIKAGQQANIEMSVDGVYAATQGPRLESAAEINRLERDGCDMVGMTGMPEAALAKELGLCYATCAIVSNRAAGRGQKVITMDEVEKNLHTGMEKVCSLLSQVIPHL